MEDKRSGLRVDSRSILHKHRTLKPPVSYSIELNKNEDDFPPLFSTLQKIKQKFREEITLDLDTAHLSLVVSEDKMSLTFLKTDQTVPVKPALIMDSLALLGS